MALDTKYLSIKNLIVWVVIFAEMIGHDAIGPLIKDEGDNGEQNLKILAASDLIDKCPYLQNYQPEISRVICQQQ
jgi:hypothetical protein